MANEHLSLRQRAPAACSSGPSARRTRVLVVDDNEENRALARATLEAEEMDVALAPSGEEAVRLFAADLPDCVLMDVKMPGMSGFEASDRIRSLPHGANTPVVFLTALRDIDTFDRARAAGGDDFLTKPFRPHELVARVRVALEVRRLSAELGTVYELMKRQRDELMRLQLQKERLSVFIVHDLKGPVNTMDLFAQVLARNGSLPPDVLDSARSIRVAARHAIRLITNLLDLSKSEEGKLVPRCESVDARGLVGEVLEAMAMPARSSGVQLAGIADLPSLFCDRDLVERVLENLVDNAIRHTPRGGQVTLRLRPVEDAVHVCVSDDGPGIPQEMSGKIFDPFVQLGGPAEAGAAQRGRGLGLAFCKAAVEAHGGRIWVEPSPAGAQICLSLPRGT